jgi:putative peptidoglycan lipid II flippase
LPQLSRSIHAGRHEEAQEATDQAVVLSLALSLPAAAALMAMPFFLMDGLWTRGQFTVADAHATANVLFYYGLAVPAFVLRQILQPAFFARQDTRSPMRFALVSVVVNVVVGVALFFVMGVPGIAAATAVAAWVNVGQMMYALAKKGHYRASSQTISRLVRVLLATVLLGLMLAAAQAYRPVLEAPFHGMHGAKEITVIAVTIAAALVYPILLFAFGGVTPAELKAVLKRKRAA